jgi:glycosyltransferase involved in cell wall biosynthesis
MQIENKIIIFHGINEANYFKKGNGYFEDALKIIQNKYPEKVDIITARSVAYATYIDLYNKSHIVLDQVFTYDQGYNALEAMAKGKVVFTGAEKEFEEYYQLNDPVCINALPNVESLVSSLSYLIENQQQITAISVRARQFIEKEHNYRTVAARYLSAWDEE